MEFGLLGKKLGHSYSPQIHSMLYPHPYSLIEKNEDELHSFFESFSYRGINVTIPYKKEVIKYLNKISPIAEKIGAVNTIVKTQKGLYGHNTDYYGFMYMVKKSGIDVKGKKVLVPGGTGGAAQTIIYTLNELGAKEIIGLSRKGENNYENLHLHRDASVIVNCTPVGMYPNNGESPLDLNIFPNLEGVLDIVYNPSFTRLLLDAKKRNIKYQNGLCMLIAQAKEAAELFLDKEFDEKIIDEIEKKLETQMKNIVLVGMPGCGKTTIGKELSKKLDREFFDADVYLEQKLGVDIPTIFKNEGEAFFRQKETEVLSELMKKSSLVISTGGGCVTVRENFDIILQNSIVVWIKRHNSMLATEGRPLSKLNSAEDIYKVRKPLYEEISHYEVENHTTIEDAVNSIIKGVIENENSCN